MNTIVNYRVTTKHCMNNLHNLHWNLQMLRPWASSKIKAVNLLLPLKSIAIISTVSFAFSAVVLNNDPPNYFLYFVQTYWALFDRRGCKNKELLWTIIPIVLQNTQRRYKSGEKNKTKWSLYLSKYEYDFVAQQLKFNNILFVDHKWRYVINCVRESI